MSKNKIIYVNDVADLPAPSGGTHTLLANTVYYFGPGTYNLSNTLTFSSGSEILGAGKTTSIINYTGVAALCNYTNANILIRDLDLRSTTGSLFNASNTSSFSTYVEDVTLRSFTSLGTIAGGGVFFRYTLALSCVNGLTLSGSLGSVILDTASFRAMSGGANSFAIKVLTGTTGTSFRSYQGIFEVAATHYGIWIEGTFTLTSGGGLTGNQFYGAGTNRLVGVNANTTGWYIPTRGNVGIAGLFVNNNVIVVGTLSSTTSATWLSVTQQVLTKNAISDYEPNATVLKGVLTVGMTHDATGGDVGFRLFNLTDNVAVTGSTVANLIITTGLVYQVAATAEFDLLLGKEYRVQIIKNTGTGGQSVYINAGDLQIKAY